MPGAGASCHDASIQHMFAPVQSALLVQGAAIAEFESTKVTNVIANIVFVIFIKVYLIYFFNGCNIFNLFPIFIVTYTRNMDVIHDKARYVSKVKDF
jgi:hypothetical protein